MNIENKNGSYAERDYKYPVLKGTDTEFTGKITVETKDQYEFKTRTICYVTTPYGRHKYQKGSALTASIKRALLRIKKGQINNNTTQMIELATFDFKCADNAVRKFSLKKENQNNATALMTILSPATVTAGLIQFEVADTDDMYVFATAEEFTQWYTMASGIVSALYKSGKTIKKSADTATDVLGLVDDREPTQIITATQLQLQGILT